VARLIIGFAQDASPLEATRAGAVKFVEVGGGPPLELHSQGVRSEDGTTWYWVEVDDAAAARLAEQVRGAEGVVSAYVQPPEGPP